MRWLLERGGPIERFNQAMLLQVPAGLQGEHLIAALQAVLDHHDALRLRLDASAGSERVDAWRSRRPARWWRATACGGSTFAGSMPRRRCAPALRRRRKPPSCRLAPAAGMMVQAVWFDAGAEQSGRLLLTIHHLAVDGVSWRILVPDLAAAWEAIASGREPALPARSTSFRRWAQRLAVEAQDAEARAASFRSGAGC